jgi:signal transduction histidine kinase
MNAGVRATAASLVPYFVLNVSVVLYLAVGDDPQPVTLVNLGIAALAALWMLWWFTLHRAWRQRRALMTVFVVGVLVFFGVLGWRHSAFGFFAYAGYIYSCEVLPGRWKFAGVSATGVLAAAPLVGGYPSADVQSIGIYVGAMVFIVTLACTITYFYYVNAGLQARLVIQAREAGVLDERQRMAREIHDTLAQGFTAIITQLQAAEQSGDWRKHVGTATRLARENLTEARRSVHALRPAQLENSALPEALAEVVDGWAGAQGVHVELTTTGTARPMHPEVEVALLRTAQEALANVAKHARASRVGLTLSYMEDLVTLDVRDDGAGFDPDLVQSDGFGLTTMRQRMSRLAGELAVESEPGRGTAVSASLPAIPAEVAR